jgi:hypothetical protein
MSLYIIGQYHGSYMITVKVGVGADNDLVPPEVAQIEGAYVLNMLTLYLYAAAYNLYKVGYLFIFENLIVVRLRQLSILPLTGFIA